MESTDAVKHKIDELIAEKHRHGTQRRGFGEQSAEFTEVVQMAVIEDVQERINDRPVYMIDPRSTGMSYWDSITSLALVFTAVVTPVEVAFLPTATSVLEPVFILNRVLDVIFILDMLANFFIMYKVEAFGRDAILDANAAWEYRLSKTARRYVRTWFVWDALSVGASGFDYLALNSSSTEECHAGAGKNPLKLLRLVRVLRLIKLVRLLKASRVIARIERRNTMKYAYLSIVAVVLQVLIIAHWFTCVLGITVVLAFDSPLDAWPAKFGFCKPGSPMVDPCTGKRTVICVDEAELYTKALYWALGLVTGFSSVPSPGPFEPHFADGTLRLFSMTEDVVLIVIAFVSSAVWAYVTGVIVDLVSNFDPDKTTFWKLMDELNLFSSFYNLDHKTTLALRDFYHEKREVLRIEARKRTVEGLSPKLQAEICWATSAQWLVQIEIFANASKPFMVQIALSMTPQVYAPADRPPARRLYVLFKGLCKYGVRTLTPGMTFGESDVLMQGSHHKRMRAVCKSYVHVKFITSEKLMEVASAYPETYCILRSITAWQVLKSELLTALKAAASSRRPLTRQSEPAQASPSDLDIHKLVQDCHAANQGLLDAVKKLDLNTTTASMSLATGTQARFGFGGEGELWA